MGFVKTTDNQLRLTFYLIFLIFLYIYSFLQFPHSTAMFSHWCLDSHLKKGKVNIYFQF